MKKGIYIALFLIGLVFASCQKQEIVPNTNTVQDIPTWESSSNRAPNDIEDDNDNGSDDPNGIVDPNNPSDGLKKP